ncbi:hypothetical protein [Nocardia crassostreae]|uniref:hypothetical protein n=1 Tax=Nocardia crassostreae TaxID=53428 RepID=UPI000B0F896F|nr:hypothetical protein [Nocardia crassostreae]
MLLRNLATISDQIGGRAPQAATLLKGISDVFVALQEKFDGLLDLADIAPSVLGGLNSLLATFGFTRPGNPDLEADLRLAFPDPQAAIDTLNRLPALLQSLIALIPTRDHGAEATCSRGQAEVPGVLSVLFAGQQVSICNG